VLQWYEVSLSIRLSDDTLHTDGVGERDADGAVGVRVAKGMRSEDPFAAIAASAGLDLGVDVDGSTDRSEVCGVDLCGVLHGVAVCCSVLQCVAVCCSVLQCVAVCCSVL